MAKVIKNVVKLDEHPASIEAEAAQINLTPAAQETSIKEDILRKPAYKTKLVRDSEKPIKPTILFYNHDKLT